MPLREYRLSYRPAEYEKAREYWLKAHNSHWLHTDTPLSGDAMDWKTKLTEAERKVIGGVLKGFTLSETVIGDYWSELVAKWFPVHEIVAMSKAFGDFECFDDQSMLLTSSGWKMCKDITTKDKVAQYNLDTKEISFVYPLKVVSYDYEGMLDSYQEGDKTNIVVTPNHDMICLLGKEKKKLKSTYLGKVSTKYSYPKNGALQGRKQNLSVTEKLYATVGCAIKSENNNQVEIEDKQELKDELDRLNWKYTASTDCIKVAVPYSLMSSLYSFSWVMYRSISSSWCKELKELLETKEEVEANPTAKSTYLAMCALSKDIYDTQQVEEYPFSQPVKYKGKVYCVSVPYQNLVSRRGDCVAITGNTIHAEAYNNLNETLGLDDFEAFLQDEAARNKFEFLQKAEESATEEDIAQSLAIFSAFSEGVSLFSSFAILMFFSSTNLLKGIGKIVEYSAKDECFPDGTEVLTVEGWKDLAEVTTNDIVAEFDTETGFIYFSKPERKIEKYIEEEELCYITNNSYRLNCTANHDLLVKDLSTAEIIKVPAKSLKDKSRTRLRVSGHKPKVSSNSAISKLDNVHIAIAVCGEERDGRIYMPMSILKRRRLIALLRDLNIKYEINSDAELSLEDIYKATPNSFSWLDLSKVGGAWANQAITEISYWSSNKAPNSSVETQIYNPSKEVIDVCQALAAISGCVAEVKVLNACDQLLKVYRKTWEDLTPDNIKISNYTGFVRCLTMPKGTLVVRYKNSVSITGNCLHSEAGCWLYRTYIQENPHLNTPELKEKIYEAARAIVQMESSFIDSVFSLGEINRVGTSGEKIDSYSLKEFIKDRANTKLQELGLKPIMEVDEKAAESISSWFAIYTQGVRQQDFFAGVETAYGKGVQQFDELSFDFE